MEELVAGLLRPRLFPFGKLSKAKSAAQLRLIVQTMPIQSAVVSGKGNRIIPTWRPNQKKNWSNFMKLTTYTSVAIVVVLALMAIFLL